VIFITAALKYRKEAN